MRKTSPLVLVIGMDKTAGTPKGGVYWEIKVYFETDVLNLRTVTSIL